MPDLSPSERQSYPLLPSAQTCSPGPRPSQRDSVEPHVVRSSTSLSVPPTNSSRRDPATDSSLGKEMGSGERPRRGDQPLHPQHPRTGGAKHEIHEELFPENPYLGRATSSVAPDHAPHRRQLFTSSSTRFVGSRSLMNSVEKPPFF